jgi:hypothetical protein
MNTADRQKRTLDLIEFVGDLAVPTLAVIARPVQTYFPANEFAFQAAEDIEASELEAISAFFQAEQSLV